jgi:Fur family ferric uptake transcriptional regulator
METRIHDILKRNQLSVTDSRTKILELFLQQEGAVAHGDIEKKTGREV